MYQPFQTLPDSSRVWVYQSNRPLNAGDKASISEILTRFTTDWEVHGKPMHSSFEILDDHFVILSADEQVNAASGCSIDDSVRTIRQLGEQLSIDFFDRHQVVLVRDNQFQLTPLSAVRRSLEDRLLDENSQVINTLILTKLELKEKWIVPLGNSWLKRFLPQTSVSQ